MGIFAKQVLRLRRKKWTDINEFAEEVYTILNSDDPIEIDSPVIITNNTNNSPLTIRNYGANDNAINIQRQETINNNFSNDFTDRRTYGEYEYTNIYNNGTIETWSDDAGIDRELSDPPKKGTGDPVPSTQGAGGGGIPAKVVSGSGTTYIMQIYTDGTGEPFTTATVTQLQAFASSSFPAGTWTLVSLINGTYYMQLPIWL